MLLPVMRDPCSFVHETRLSVVIKAPNLLAGRPTIESDVLILSESPQDRLCRSAAK